ncbi:hypothetical protein ABLE91_07175 [Aquabacter sp. CN5-332]|uniref:hypothetical protein n=1 Tax=Aquabacter sp. CN5-332 TaxID=3156608 RepID=UPI0032B414E6
MVLRAVFLFIAAAFLCVGTAFLGVGLYEALLLGLAPWAAGLLTGLAGFLIAGIIAAIATHRRPSEAAPLGSMAFGAASASIYRIIGNHPLATIAAAAAAGFLQSFLTGRRR